MKVLKGSKKKLAIIWSLVAVMIIGAVASSAIIKSKAAGNYFSEYEGVVTGIEHIPYYGIQSLAMYGDYAFYIKVTEGQDPERKAGVWAYNCATGEKKKVYNGHTDNAVFKLGHANCASIVGNYLYVATCVSDWTVSRFNIEDGGDRFYLTNRVNYTFKNKSGANVQLTGLEYAPELGGFLAKNGDYIFLGNFSGNEFKCTKTYKLGLSLTFKNAQGNTETLDLDRNKTFVRQGIYYKDNYLYLPVHNGKVKRQSLVVAYPLTASTPSGATLQPSGDRVVRITSNQAYPHTFEIEGIAAYKGKMIISVNAKKTENESNDFITYVKGFRY